MSKATHPAEIRFWKHVTFCPNTGCWLWVGSTSSGYGELKTGRRHSKNIAAHRLSYRMHYGRTDDLLVCHRCDQPLCVNPAHLFLGTPKDNAADCLAKRRHADTRGEKHKNAKLTETDVRAIRATNGKNKDVAKLFGVCTSTIQQIKSRRIWSHI